MPSRIITFVPAILCAIIFFILMVVFATRYTTNDKTGEECIRRDSRDSRDSDASDDQICAIWQPFFATKGMCRRGKLTSQGGACIPSLMWTPMSFGILCIISVILAVGALLTKKPKDL
jgi:hypothetical protein